MTETILSPVLEHRVDLLLLFDVADGNPNGDPDAGNMPRVDPETLQGLVTDGCLKRKVRDFVTIVKTGPDGQAAPGHAIYFQHRGVLNAQHQQALQAVEPTMPEGAGRADRSAAARAWMCANCWDVRTFGAVMAMKEHNCGQVRGPVQFSFARSFHPILQQEHAITRKSVTKQEDADEQIAKHGEITGTMGRKFTVPYGLYKTAGFVSAHLARDTGFTRADLDLLLRALIEMWDHDHSAARGVMAMRKLYAFEHASTLGEAPAHKLLRLVDVRLKPGIETPRAFEDYAITVDAAGLPPGVSVSELVDGEHWGEALHD